jgi:hypothetical protein
VRNAPRVGALAASLPLSVVLAGTALASGSPDDGPPRSNGLTTVETLGLLIGIPVLIIVVIWLLVYATNRPSGERYRPGLSWWAAPEWFNGPGSAEPVSTDEQQETTAELAAAPVEGVGGARARW